MKFRFSFRMALAIACGLFVVGCRTQPPISAELLPDAPTTPTGKISARARADEQNTIEAHAHYGTGVVRALGEEIEPALNEFYAAIQKDPGNVPLVMEVSQGFIQAGQSEK